MVERGELDFEEGSLLRDLTINGLDTHVWWAFHTHSPRLPIRVIDAMRAAMFKLLDEAVTAQPPLSTKKRRALKLCRKFANEGNLASAAKKAVRVGVSAEHLNAIATLLSK